MRTEDGLNSGLNRLAEIRDELTTIGVDDSNLAFNLTWHDWLNMASLVEVSEVITQAALARENSRGAHFREDFPEQGDLDESYYTVAKTLPPDVPSPPGGGLGRGHGGTSVTRSPVQFSIVRPGETVLPDDAPETLVAAE